VEPPEELTALLGRPAQFATIPASLDALAEKL
jgi:hypothetical protein